MQDGTADTGSNGTTPESPASAPNPSPEAQQLAAQLTGAEPTEPQGRAEPTPSTAEGPPVIESAFRVAMDGGQRHVELTPDQVAELLTEREQRGDIDAARRELQLERQGMAIFESLGPAVERMTPEQQQAFFHIAFNDPSRLDGLGGQQPSEPAEPSERQQVQQLVDGQRPQQPSRNQDPQIAELTRTVQTLVQREQQREQAAQQETLGQQVDRAMAEYSVFKRDPQGTRADAPIAAFARNQIMLQLGQSQNPGQDLSRVIAQVANQASQFAQAERQSAVERVSPPPVSRSAGNINGPDRRLGATDLRNGGVMRAAQAELQQLFAPDYPQRR